MVSLRKSAETISAGTDAGNGLRAARFLTHLINHIGILPNVSLVKGPRVSLVKAYAPVYVSLFKAYAPVYA